MAIELKMPALSPTMEEGTLAKWLVKAGDSVKSGDILAEIETDKATMEFEAIDEGVVTEILVAEGSEGVKVGTVIARISGEDEEAAKPSALQGARIGNGNGLPPAIQQSSPGDLIDHSHPSRLGEGTVTVSATLPPPPADRKSVV